MASLLFREIKGMNLSCASPSSSAICSSIHQRSIIQPVTGRPMDRRTSHVRDPRGTKAQFTSKPRSHNPKSDRKISEKQPKKPDLVSPADSSRYLLNSSRFRLEDAAFYHVFPDSEPSPHLCLTETSKSRCERSHERAAVLGPSASTRTQDQVVVLRVSLHCKGCEGKVRRHIAKMQGVTSFSVDLATKKVTVIGDVTPLGVLNSISKVKNAQFWQSPPRASASF